MRLFVLLLGLLSVSAWAADTETQRVLPEVASTITLSNRDVNRLVCANGGPVSSPVYSDEKPVQVLAGKDGRSYYVKFRVMSDNVTGDQKYYGEPTELYVTCGKSVYELVIHPTYSDRQTVYLGNDTADRMHANQELMGAMSLEEAAVMLSMAVIKDAKDQDPLPTSFTSRPVTSPRWATGLTDKQGRPVAVHIKKVRDVLVDGTGLRASHYLIQADANVMLDELMFLSPSFGSNIFTVTLEALYLHKGMQTTLVIVQREGA